LIRKLPTKQVLLTILLFLNIFSFAIKIGFSQATVPIAKGSNFNLYYVVGDELMFQHLKTDYMKAFNASVKVTSGTLNGTDGKLEMYIAEGMISWSVCLEARYMRLVRGNITNTMKSLPMV